MYFLHVSNINYNLSTQISISFYQPSTIKYRILFMCLAINNNNHGCVLWYPDSCVYIYIYIYMYIHNVCMYLCMYVCIYAYTYIYTYI